MIDSFKIRLGQTESAAMMKLDITYELGYATIRSRSPQELIRIVSGLIFAGFRSIQLFPAGNGKTLTKKNEGIVIVHMDEEYNNSGFWIG